MKWLLTNIEKMTYSFVAKNVIKRHGKDTCLRIYDHGPDTEIIFVKEDVEMYLLVNQKSTFFAVEIVHIKTKGILKHEIEININSEKKIRTGDNVFFNMINIPDYIYPLSDLPVM
jgi:hypothetical protein